MSYVLLIEDNQLNAEVIMILLRSITLEVKHTLRGLDGAKLARQERPSLILMDFDLPDIDGRTLALSLKKELGDMDAPPIVAVTARIGKNEERFAKQFGCTAFVSKPIVEEDFIALVRKLLTIPSEPT
jgi:CheY-like chemotaxis protein